MPLRVQGLHAVVQPGGVLLQLGVDALYRAYGFLHGQPVLFGPVAGEELGRALVGAEQDAAQRGLDALGVRLALGLALPRRALGLGGAGRWSGRSGSTALGREHLVEQRIGHALLHTLRWDGVRSPQLVQELLPERRAFGV